MNKEVILTAKTVEEAMDEARRQYGTPENELSFEILDMPKKGFLGIGAAPARVKVTVSKALEDVNLSDLVSELRSMKLTADEKPEKTPAKPEKREQKPQQQKSQQQPKAQQNQGKAQQTPQSQPKSEKQPAKPQQNPPKAQQKPQQPKAEGKPAQPKAEGKPAQPKPETKPEIKAEIKTDAPKSAAPISDSELPAALRRPAARPEQTKKKKPEKKPQPRREDNRGAEEKKQDLLSAVMGVNTQAKTAPAAAPTAHERAPLTRDEIIAKAVAEETVTETVTPPSMEAETESARDLDAIISRAVNIAAENTIVLSDDGESAAETAEPETPRLEFITPAEMDYAITFTQTLLDNMKLGAKAVPGDAPEGTEIPEGTVPARIMITGEETGILIGHHGETLDAIQYLTNLCASRKSGSSKRDFVKILIDIGNYREKREETLRSLARRMAARAVKYKRNVVLEPMNPYERRIIHSEVHGIADVATHSVGSDENRKIVITYEGADKAPSRGRGRGDRRGRGRDRGERAPRGEKTERPSRPAKAERPATPRQKPNRAKSIDEIRIDLSEDSVKTFGSVGIDEGYEKDVDPIEKIAAAAEAEDENLREY